ncbi:hypothetical protein FRC11_012892 [Ceratobasidium sp. 423]|nr:hypothetical protein FRC11_012892 [Ceratobasidium sp. 423]
MSSDKTRAKVFTSLDTPGRKSAQRVLEGVANSRCMIVLGAGVSVAAELPDYRSPGIGILTSTFDILGQRFKGKDLFLSTTGPAANQLFALNHIMTTLRQHARTAELTDCHRLITLMLDTGRAAKCLTRNFDGLETRERPDLSSKVIEMHGSNNWLSCPAGHLPVGPGDILQYDDDFLKGIELTCPTCLEKRQERSEKDKRLRNNNTIYNLRPAVYLDERLVPDLHDVEVRAGLLSEASSCQVLLIAGTSLSTPQVYQLVLELAEKIQASEGVVVFINTKTTLKGRILRCFDYYLQIDVQHCAQFISNLIAKQVCYFAGI